MKIKFEKIGRIMCNRFYFEAEKGIQWIPDTLRCYKIINLAKQDNDGLYRHWGLINEYIDLHRDIKRQLRQIITNYLRSRL